MLARSLGEVCLPSEVKAFQFISLDNTVTVSIAFGVLEAQRAEQLVG